MDQVKEVGRRRGRQLVVKESAAGAKKDMQQKENRIRSCKAV